MEQSLWGTPVTERPIPSGKVINVRSEENKAYVTFERGEARLESYGAGILRMTLTSGVFMNLKSVAVIQNLDENISISREGEGFGILCGGLTVSLSDEQPRVVVLNSRMESLFILEPAFYKARDRVIIHAGMAPDARIYGLGEKTGFLDKRGRRYEMWNTDDPLHTPDKDPLYKSIPFMILSQAGRTFGLFLDSTARSFFDLGFTRPDAWEISVCDEEMDLYVIEGDDIAEVIARYTLLTGRMELPPLWALGYQQCRWSYYPQEKVLALTDTFREKGIPCDVIYLDIDYMDDYRVFTWNSDRFPDPAGMNAALLEKGFRVVTIIDPGVKRDSDYDVYQEGLRAGAFCKLPTGEVYHGEVWPGAAAYPDFSREETRKWWGHQHARLFYSGVSGIWNDMNEPSDFAPETEGDRRKATVPSDVMLDNDGRPRSFAKGHNAYGLHMCRATREGFAALKPEERPFIVTRSAYAGIQRYAAVWTGDNHSWWEHLVSSIPMHLNIGLSGIPFVGGDVGGFQGECSPELFARWMQLGAFTPFFRAHSAIHTRDHEPWAFGPETENAAREAIRLRYSLLPYLYSAFKHASETGLPIMRPLMLDYQEDPNTHTIQDAFLFGSDILVAPVTRPGDRKRLVYLPKGRWYDFYSKEAHEGGKHHIVNAPLDRIPLFVREGAILPRIAPEASTRFLDWSQLQLEVYAGAEGAFTLYEDDGLSLNYQQGFFNLVTFTQTPEGKGLRFKVLYASRGYENGFKKATVSVYGLQAGLEASAGACENSVYRFEIGDGDGEVSIG